MTIKEYNGELLCPRIEGHAKRSVCSNCVFLAILTADGCKCRWTKEKEQLLKGEKYYN